jgi:hypothetical protein
VAELARSIRVEASGTTPVGVGVVVGVGVSVIPRGPLSSAIATATNVDERAKISTAKVISLPVFVIEVLLLDVKREYITKSRWAQVID